MLLTGGCYHAEWPPCIWTTSEHIEPSVKLYINLEGHLLIKPAKMLLGRSTLTPVWELGTKGGALNAQKPNECSNVVWPRFSEHNCNYPVHRVPESPRRKNEKANISHSMTRICYSRSSALRSRLTSTHRPSVAGISIQGKGLGMRSLW